MDSLQPHRPFFDPLFLDLPSRFRSFYTNLVSALDDSAPDQQQKMLYVVEQIKGHKMDYCRLKQRLRNLSESCLKPSCLICNNARSVIAVVESVQKKQERKALLLSDPEEDELVREFQNDHPRV